MLPLSHASTRNPSSSRSKSFNNVQPTKPPSMRLLTHPFRRLDLNASSFPSSSPTNTRPSPNLNPSILDRRPRHFTHLNPTPRRATQSRSTLMSRNPPLTISTNISSCHSMGQSTARSPFLALPTTMPMRPSQPTTTRNSSSRSSSRRTSLHRPPPLVNLKHRLTCHPTHPSSNRLSNRTLSSLSPNPTTLGPTRHPNHLPTLLLPRPLPLPTTPPLPLPSSPTPHPRSCSTHLLSSSLQQPISSPRPPNPSTLAPPRHRMPSRVPAQTHSKEGIGASTTASRSVWEREEEERTRRWISGTGYPRVSRWSAGRISLGGATTATAMALRARYHSTFRSLPICAYSYFSLCIDDNVFASSDPSCVLLLSKGRASREERNVNARSCLVAHKVSRSA
jgi:hypothetical protein